jgi:S1-C subfamily serine protease
MDLDPDQRGILVVDVTAGGPANEAGLQGSEEQIEIDGREVRVGGDVITAVDGVELRDFEDLVAYLAHSASVGDTIALTVLRDGGEIDLELELAERPEQPEPQMTIPQGRSSGRAWLGIQGMDVTPEVAQEMDLPESQRGVLVASVVDEGPADEAGLREGDIILAADEIEIKDMDALVEALGELSPDDELELSLLRDGKEITVTVTLGERPMSMDR